MIEELQAGTGALNDIMEKTGGTRRQQPAAITEVGPTSTNSAATATPCWEMSTQIATSSEEQSSVAEEITRQPDRVRQEACQVEESASAAVAGTTGPKATATELNQAMTGLRIRGFAPQMRRSSSGWPFSLTQYGNDGLFSSIALAVVDHWHCLVWSPSCRVVGRTA